MPRGLVNEVQLLVAFGLPYHHIHQRKDAASPSLPGLRHRRIRHGWYRSYGKLLNLDDPFPDAIGERTSRTATLKDAVRAEEYMSWVAHDFLDKIWDFDGLTTEQRAYTEMVGGVLHMAAFAARRPQGLGRLRCRNRKDSATHRRE